VCIVDETQCELTIVGEEGRKACVVLDRVHRAPLHESQYIFTDGAHHENPRETLLIPIDEAFDETQCELTIVGEEGRKACVVHCG
jgi:hypothetical protein